MNTVLPAQAIKEYQDLVKKHFGKDLSFEEARINAEEFINFYKTVHRPLKKKWIEDYEKKRKNK